MPNRIVKAKQPIEPITVKAVAQPSIGAASPQHGLDKWGGKTKAGIAWEVRRGDAATTLASLVQDRFSCVVTSPPYFSQRDYKVEGQIGLEATIALYVKRITEAFDQVRRVLSPTGVLFLNLGDTYYSGRGEPKGNDKGVTRISLRRGTPV